MGGADMPNMSGGGAHPKGSQAQRKKVRDSGGNRRLRRSTPFAGIRMKMEVLAYSLMRSKPSYMPGSAFSLRTPRQSVKQLGCVAGPQAVLAIF